VLSEPAIFVQGLTFAYPQGPTALADVSFSVQAGESVGLVGPNGAGKTSLFLCLSGVLAARAGTVRVGGLDVRDPVQRKKLPSQVGIVFQNSDDQLFSATVFDDVAFGPLNLGCSDAEVRTRVAEALARVGMTGQEGRVPFHLSGGEKRRVALAGVLAMRPAVLLLDEPSMDLDPRGRRELIGLLGTLGGTRLIASHDLELILQTCGRVLVLDAGRVMADGGPRSVLGDEALMERHGLEVPYSLRGRS
jgi:cobalt/nickel transport system ATP-binding protein